jgi:cyclic dehypoxanthinyl futalosine synthase
MTTPRVPSAAAIDALLARGSAGDRLTLEEGLSLFAAPLLELGLAAEARCRTLHPEPTRTFVIGRNINYSNICTCGCRCCAFFRVPDHPDGYTLAMDEVLAKVEEMVDAGGTEVLLQGGLNPHLRLRWFETLFHAIRTTFPTASLHALSPSELLHLAELEALPVATILARLQRAGLASIPGASAEILVDRVRARISPRKCSVDAWLAVMRCAQALGLPTTATMMYGHVETLAERLEHLVRIRALQDATRGFVGFIPWAFQAGNSALTDDVVPQESAGGAEFLRMLAISRLFLDNVPNLQSSWVTQGMKIGQLGLSFGANDLGSTMMEERVVSAAGTTFQTNAAELARLIADLGFIPAQRTTDYAIVRQWRLI